MSAWDPHIIRGSYCLGAIALGYISRLPPGTFYTAESLAREVTRILYSSAPEESQDAAHRGVLKVITILMSEMNSILAHPPLDKLPHEELVAYAARLKAETEVLARVTPEHLTSQ